MPLRKTEPAASVVKSGVAHFGYERTEDEETIIGVPSVSPRPAASTPAATATAVVTAARQKVSCRSGLPG